MLDTVVPMEQIFLAEPLDCPGGRAAGSGGVSAAPAAFYCMGLKAEAALGGAMVRLDYRTATGAFPC